MNKKYSDRRLRGPAPIAAALLACISAILLPSCARKAVQAAPASGQAQAAASQAPRSASLPGVPGDQRPAAAAAGSASAPKPAPALAASLRAFGLGARTRPRMPEDFSLGPLQSLRPASKEEEAPLAAARAFLDGVAAGKVDPSIYLPEARAALAALLEPRPVKDGIAASGARLGAIYVEGSAASLRVRLPGTAGSARNEGLLSLREEGGAWYVEALALDPPTSAALAFDPGARPDAR
jgi:hypothetical protein